MLGELMSGEEIPGEILLGDELPGKLLFGGEFLLIPKYTSKAFYTNSQLKTVKLYGIFFKAEDAALPFGKARTITQSGGKITAIL
jgi:hypothetical protein